MKTHKETACRIVRPFVLLIVAMAVTPILVTRAADVEVIPDVIYGHKDGWLDLRCPAPKDQTNGAAVIFMVTVLGIDVCSTGAIDRAIQDARQGLHGHSSKARKQPRYFIPEIVVTFRRRCALTPSMPASGDRPESTGSIRRQRRWTPFTRPRHGI
jgi:hypothetical protein